MINQEALRPLKHSPASFRFFSRCPKTLNHWDAATDPNRIQ